MANRRSKVIDAIVNPAVMPGFTMFADTVTLTDTKVLTVTFPAKSIVAVIASPTVVLTEATITLAGTGTVDFTKSSLTWAASVSGNVGTVTFTADDSVGGTVIKFSYIILATPTEVIAANAITTNTTETPVQ